jgi:hypothetical protein
MVIVIKPSFGNASAAALHERTMGAVRARLLKYGRINA